MGEVVRLVLWAMDAASDIAWSSWVSTAIAVLALIVAALSLVISALGYLTVLWRGKKRVRIRSSEAVEDLAKGGPFYYRCLVTNVGYIGVQIDGVALYPAAGTRGVGIPLTLPRGEQPRKLDQGESQEWGILLDDLHARLQGEGRLEVVAVATDTAGGEHEQRRKDSLSVDLSS